MSGGWDALQLWWSSGLYIHLENPVFLVQLARIVAKLPNYRGNSEESNSETPMIGGLVGL